MVINRRFRIQFKFNKEIKYLIEKKYNDDIEFIDAYIRKKINVYLHKNVLVMFDVKIWKLFFVFLNALKKKRKKVVKNRVLYIIFHQNDVALGLREFETG